MVQSIITAQDNGDLNDLRNFVDISPPSSRGSLIAGAAGMDLCIYAVYAVGGALGNVLLYDGAGSRFLTVYLTANSQELVNPHPLFWRLTTGNGLEGLHSGGAGNEEIHVWYKYLPPL